MKDSRVRRIIMVPQGLYYTDQHEWIKIEDGVGTVGITDHAQQQLGEVTFVELPENGPVDANAELAVLESSKAASDVYAPMAGEVIEVNEALESQPELVNQQCYTDGWICKIKLSDPDAVSNLMDAAAYEAFITNE